MVLSTLQTVGLLVGISYYILTLRNQNRARQAQLFMQLYNRVGDPDFRERLNEVFSMQWDDIDDFRQKFLGTGYSTSLHVVMNFFHGFGVLLQKGLIDGDLLYEQIPTNAYTLWDKYEPWAKWVREKANYPQYMKLWEYLANEMKKIALSRGDPILNLKDFTDVFRKPE